MSGMSSVWHPEVLSLAQRSVLDRLGALATRMGFYLGGGTAIALYLGHRRSIDLDWFTSSPLPAPRDLVKELGREGIALGVRRWERGTVHGLVARVRVSFFEYQYPSLHAARTWPEVGCRLASLDDLACMKLVAVAQRGARKDFVDIYALVTRHRPLPRLLSLYKRRYSMTDLAPVLYGLTYFDDAEGEPMPRMLWKVRWPVVREAIRQWVREAST